MRKMFEFLVFLVSLWIAPILTQSPVYILNQHSQLVTSSTLQWANAQNGDRPINAVKGGHNGTSDYFVCRATLAGGGGYHSGQLRTQACRIVVGDVPLSYRTYQVLVNIDGAARLEWAKWKQFQSVPTGAISVDGADVYAARALVSQHTPIADIPSDVPSVQIIRKVLALGGLYLKQQYGTILVPENHGQMKQTEGQVLTEHEPVSYELTNFVELRLRHEVHSQLQLEETKDLEIDSDSSGRIFNISYTSAIYFGKGHSIPTGSEVMIHYRNRTREYVTWGVAKKHQEMRQLRLTYQVPLWTKVKVTIQATEIKKNFEYSATLLSHYSDGAILMRPIKGVFQRTVFDNFRPLYSSPEPSVSTHVSTAHSSVPSSTMIKSYRYPLDDMLSSTGRKPALTDTPMSANERADQPANQNKGHVTTNWWQRTNDCAMTRLSTVVILVTVALNFFC